MKQILIACLMLAVFCGATLALDRLEDPEITRLASGPGVVVMNFWATWCQPCVREIPVLNEMQGKYRLAQIVGVNMDYAENSGAIPGFLKKHPIQYRIIMRRGGDFRGLAGSLDPNWTAGLPATFIFKDGKRIYSRIGQIDPAELDRVLNGAMK